MRTLVHRTLKRFGFDLIRYPLGTLHGTVLRQTLAELRPDVLVDAGAHAGVFSDLLRKHGFDGHIVSFEPVPALAEGLRRRAAGDERWTVCEAALGDVPSRRTLNIADDLRLTSLLVGSPRGVRQRATLRRTTPHEVEVVRLDDVLDDLAPGPAERIFLKSDTQGWDMHVLEGATRVLERVVAIHVELSLQESYDGAADYLDVLAWARARGFEPADLVTQGRDAGLLNEVDCLLRRCRS